jgi:hypothetical protein
MTGALALSPAVPVAVAVMLEEKVEGRGRGTPAKLPSGATVSSTVWEAQPETLSARLTLTVSPGTKLAPDRPTVAPGA